MDRIIARMKKSSGRRGEKTPSRRLERRDAAKHINYDAASTSSSSAEDLSVSTSSSSLMTRSLEFPDRTSFRIFGGGDGEMDRIYKSIGVSGPDDLAISFDAWEASKKRSSSDVFSRFPVKDSSEAGPSGGDDDSVAGNSKTELTRSESSEIGSFRNLVGKVVVDGGGIEENKRGLELDVPKFQVRDVSEAGRSGGDDSVAANRKTELTRSESSEIGSYRDLVDGRGIEENKPVLELDVYNHKFQVRDVSEANNNTELMRSESSKPGLVRAPTITVKSRGYLVPNPTDDVAVAVGGGGGIKGVRPPGLKPPPAKRPPIDHGGSSWDFLTHFAPEESEVVRPPSSSSSSDNGREEALEEELERVVENETMFLESADTGDEACSFTTNEGGDSSSTVSLHTSPIYSNGGAIITSWQKGGLLGRGSFGSVYEGISGGGDFFAVKEVSLLEQGSQAQECIQQLEGEIALLSQLQHQNIVRYRGTAKDGSNLYIFLELVSQGSLLKLYQRYQLMDSVVSLYTRQILDGLKYLHDKGFIHRDIKCANILVDASGAVKLADFGLAKVSKLNDIKSCKGTPFWMAPEVINPKRTDGYGSSADIWSLGCTVLEMLTGQIPYCDLENPVQALFRIGRGVLPDIPDTLSLDAQDFIIRCLKVNPEERPTAAELLNHPFVRRPLSSSGSGSGSGLGSASPYLHR